MECIDCGDKPVYQNERCFICARVYWSAKGGKARVKKGVAVNPKARSMRWAK